MNNYCTVNDIDNMSDHLPLCMDIHLPVNIMYFTDSQYFVPKPKWSSANELMLSEYRHILDLSFVIYIYIYISSNELISYVYEFGSGRGKFR